MIQMSVVLFPIQDAGCLSKVVATCLGIAAGSICSYLNTSMVLSVCSHPVYHLAGLPVGSGLYLELRASKCTRVVVVGTTQDSWASVCSQ